MSQEYSIFSFQFSPQGEIYRMAARDHQEIIFLSNFITKFREKLSTFKIISIEHNKNGNKIKYKPQYPFSVNYQYDEEILKSLKINLEEDSPIDIREIDFGEAPPQSLEEFMKETNNYPEIMIENLECNVEIKLNNSEMAYQERYIYGPTESKSFDLAETPVAFLQQGLDMFDYENIEEIILKVKRGNIYERYANSEDSRPY